MSWSSNGYRCENVDRLMWISSGKCLRRLNVCDIVLKIVIKMFSFPKLFLFNYNNFVVQDTSGCRNDERRYKVRVTDLFVYMHVLESLLHVEWMRPIQAYGESPPVNRQLRFIGTITCFRAMPINRRALHWCVYILCRPTYSLAMIMLQYCTTIRSKL